MTPEDLQLLIKEGEGLMVEFKEKYSPKIVQDIVAFANTKGGSILLGVGDDCNTKGEALTNKMKAEIVDLARNCEPSIYKNVTSASFEDQINKDISWNDISREKIKAFFKEANISVNKILPRDILPSLNLAGNTTIKNAGVL